MRRELARKATELMTFFAAVNALPKPESRKFPVFSLPNREFWASRDEFAADSLLQRRVNKLSVPLAFSARVRLLPAGANRRVGLAPTGKRRLVTAHAETSHCRLGERALRFDP
jgi:hypothetical protein